MRPKFKAAKEKAAANSTDTVKRGVGGPAGTYGCGLTVRLGESWAQRTMKTARSPSACAGRSRSGADAGAPGTGPRGPASLNIADKIRPCHERYIQGSWRPGRRFLARSSW